MKCQMPATSMLISAIGSMNFQAKFISWSMRRRGSVPRIQMKHADQREELREEPDVGRNPGEERKRRGPAAEEERDGEAADGEHAEIFAEEEERELEAGVFDVSSRR